MGDHVSVTEGSWDVYAPFLDALTLEMPAEAQALEPAPRESAPPSPVSGTLKFTCVVPLT